MTVKQGSNKRTLAIISDCPIESYLKNGYNYVFGYYNPLGFFDTLHFFEPYPLMIKYSPRLSKTLQKLYERKHVIRHAEAMGKPYTLQIHRTLEYKEIQEVFAKNRIDCVRIYEMFSFDLAEKVSNEFRIPLVVSIH